VIARCSAISSRASASSTLPPTASAPVAPQDQNVLSPERLPPRPTPGPPPSPGIRPGGRVRHDRERVDHLARLIQGSQVGRFPRTRTPTARRVGVHERFDVRAGGVGREVASGARWRRPRDAWESRGSLSDGPPRGLRARADIEALVHAHRRGCRRSRCGGKRPTCEPWMRRAR